MNDWLKSASDQLLDIGGAVARKKFGVQEDDTKAVNTASNFPWQRVAMIGGGIVALALVLRFALKKG